MNRSHEIGFTAQADVNGVLIGPFTLVTHLVEEHKYSLFVGNLGNFPLVFTPQYMPAAGGSWTQALNVGSTTAAAYTLNGRVERTVEFAFPCGVQWRLWGRGVGGVTEGIIVVEQVDFTHNISER